MYHWFPPGVSSVTPAASLTEDQIANQISRHSRISSKVYSHAQQYCPKPDIRFLFEKSLENSSIRPSVPIDLVLVEREKGEESRINRCTIKNFVTQNFRVSSPDIEIDFIESDNDGGGGSEGSKEENEQVPFAQVFPKVALGGTFDRMHVAHKILISEAVLRCRDELIVGVTDDEMIKSIKNPFKIICIHIIAVLEIVSFLLFQVNYCMS